MYEIDLQYIVLYFTILYYSYYKSLDVQIVQAHLYISMMHVATIWILMVLHLWKIFLVVHPSVILLMIQIYMSCHIGFISTSSLLQIVI